MDNCFAGDDAPAENARHTSGRAPRRRLILVERNNGRRGEIKDRPFKELELNERIGMYASRLFHGAQSKSVYVDVRTIDIRVLFSFFRVIQTLLYAIALGDNSEIMSSMMDTFNTAYSSVHAVALNKSTDRTLVHGKKEIAAAKNCV